MIEAAGTLEGQLIVAQTELESLKQVYTSENVRVRASRARVDELERRLKDCAAGQEQARAEFTRWIRRRTVSFFTVDSRAAVIGSYLRGFISPDQSAGSCF